MNLPSDYKILSIIYKLYYDDFQRFDQSKRSSKVYVPIDIDRVAEKCNVDGDIIFGRLHYHLQKKFGYVREDGYMVFFFSKKLGNDRHCINFPLMSSVLADLYVEKDKFRVATLIAIISIAISVVSLGITLFAG